MKISSANTSVDLTIGVLENLTIDFGAKKVMLQVQVLAYTNFNLLLGHAFHCLMSVMTEDFPDRLQNITLCDLNSGKQFALPTRPWSKGCPCCHENKQCNSCQSVIEMGF